MALVLVVDDLEFVRILCRRYLEGAGHTVVEAADGADAVGAYQERRPDAVLLDLVMPGIDGLEALRQIIALDPRAKVAMLTAERERDQVLGALNLGARDYVVKPFHQDRLVEAVDRLVGRVKGS